MIFEFGRSNAAALAMGLLAFMNDSAAAAQVAQVAQQTAVIIENVRIFNGTSEQLSAPSNVLVVGNLIRTISVAAIADPAATAVTRIQGGGRTLMPGLIDAHTHLMFATVPQQALLVSDIGFVNLAAGRAATDTLMRGFTSVRDLGGPVFGLKRGDRRGARGRTADLAIGRLYLADRRSWRFPPAQRVAGGAGRSPL